MRTVIELSTRLGDSRKNLAKAIVADIPSSVQPIIDSMNLRPSSKGFACCPKCFKCYDLTNFPDRCTGTDARDDSVCNRTLRHQVLRGGKLRSYAARRYLYHDLKQWVGRLLCRPSLKNELQRDVFDTGAAPGEKKDIWDGDVLRQFTGPDGALFASQQRNEGRLVFGLNMDGFNPFGNKQAGPKASTGAIYLVCLNLPPHLRHRVENIFLVGIIPGPRHPSLTQINHLLRPLVDDLLEFWHRGVFYTHTCGHPKGRLIRAALVPVICDLPAARQIMAFASFASINFCCYCGLKLHDIDNVDMDTWPSGIKDRDEYVRKAERWRDASAKDRLKLFEDHGVRYSELLRLPYWDPLRFVVVDSMHALLLGNLKHHCRRLWGMDASTEDGDGLRTYKKEKGPDPQTIANAWAVVRHGTDAELKKLGKNILKVICFEAGLTVGGEKEKLFKCIREYVSAVAMQFPYAERAEQRFTQKLVDSFGVPLYPRMAKATKTAAPVTEEELARARSVLELASDVASFSKKFRKDILIELLRSFNATYNRSDNKVRLAEQLFAVVRLQTYTTRYPRSNRFLKRGQPLASSSLSGHCSTAIASGIPNITSSGGDFSTTASIAYSSIHPSSTSESSYLLDGLRLCSSMTDPGFLTPSASAVTPGSAVMSNVSMMPHTRPRYTAKTASVLGRNTLAEVHKDILTITLPSWIGRVPNNLGSGSHGSLSADQWRTACTVNLPTTLIRIWGPRESHSRERKMLDNFMDLVSATKYAMMRTLTAERIALYQVHISRYLKDIQKLYPDATILPNHHLSLHLTKFLQDFGPTHGWRCFPFERYNFLLQKIETSQRFGASTT